MSVHGLVVEGAERVRCVRIDRLEGVSIPRTARSTPSSSRATSGSSSPHGRLDTAQPNFALVGLMGQAERPPGRAGSSLGLGRRGHRGGQQDGAAAADRFVAEGARVVYADRDAAWLQRSRRVRIGPWRVAAVVADPASVSGLVSATLDRFSRVDVVVSNAGIWRGSPFLDVTDEEWDEVLGVNLRGTFLVCRGFARAMAAAGTGGSIIVTASTNSFLAEPDSAAYNASKGGVVMLVKSMAVDPRRPESGSTRLRQEPSAPTSTPMSSRCPRAGARCTRSRPPAAGENRTISQARSPSSPPPTRTTSPAAFSSSTAARYR